jgi:hypothetical protein
MMFPPSNNSSLRDCFPYVISMVLMLIMHLQNVKAQERVKTPIAFQGIVGGGISIFNVHGIPSSPNYSSAEGFAGARATKPIGNVFGIMSGLSLGVKFARAPYFRYFTPPNGGLYTRDPGANRTLDQSTSDKNGYYLSIPLALTANVYRSLSVYGGINGRFWWHRSHDEPTLDVLGGREELGILFGATYKLIKRLNIGLEGYSGLRNIYKGSYTHPGTSKLVYTSVINQYAMISLGYSLQ